MNHVGLSVGFRGERFRDNFGGLSPRGGDRRTGCQTSVTCRRTSVRREPSSGGDEIFGEFAARSTRGGGFEPEPTDAVESAAGERRLAG